MGTEAAQAMSALGPTAACLVLGLFPPAGAGHGSLFLLSEMGMEAAQAMSALGPKAACLVLRLFLPAGAGHGSLFCCQK